MHNTTRTLSAEMDAWKTRQMARMAALMPPPRPPRVPTVPGTSEPLPCVFSDAELDVIWPKLQNVTPRMMSFDARFLRTDRERLTPKGKALVHEIAHRYRRQMFGKASRTWHIADTVEAFQKWANRRIAENMSPLFIPLKREFFEAFERGKKTAEYRLYGPRWNERTCRVGRAVVLSFGYTHRRLCGEIVHFSISATPQLLPGWNACYGDTHRTAAVIGITVLRNPEVKHDE
ncbi:hypothetical protein [Geminisphaera colitermitum]|uniref:hypothetical protein n=1 Tax=Geminisphaera colitermitum TaxID=1148786 RepID=UPI0012FE9E4E|nr:hypothetical protein [Geminisphaera colitermitum]